MTSPFKSPQDDHTTRANWLGRYLDVEDGAIKKLSEVLSDAADSIDETFQRLFKPKNFSEKVKRSQVALAQTAIRKQVKDIFGDTTNIIHDGRQDAAVAAVNAQLYDDRSILYQVFSNQTDRDQYADSLRQTAKRNIDAVMTRVLETEKPLSERVYKTQALAGGQVSQIVNRAIAKGDSAADLAKAVKDSIDPQVPGGVAYAAKRLARTEINNAFHAQSIHDAQETPWAESMDWNLSKTHKEDPGDDCEIYAKQKTFDVNAVPEKPHPNCRCFVTPVPMDYDSFENALISGQFNGYLDGLMGEGTAEKTAGADTFEQLKGAGSFSIPGEPPEPPELSTGTPRSKAELKRNQTAKAKVQNVLPNARMVGFDDAGLDPKATKGFATIIEKLAKKFPKAAEQIQSIGFGELDLTYAYGVTTRATGDVIQATGGTASRRLLLNVDRAQDLYGEKGFQTRFNKDVDSGFHNAVPGNDSIQATVAHEFGHVIQFMFPDAGKEALTWENVRSYLVEAYANSEIPNKSEDGFKQWIADSLSGYSFQLNKDGEGIRDVQYINVEEAISEAFANVELGAGNIAEKAIHEFLIDSYREFF